MIIDRFVRTNVRKFNKAHYPVKPSEDFVHDVMMACIKEEKRQTKINCLLLIFGALAPFIGREVWLLLRNDYVSVSELPFSSLIYNAYHIFMSPITAGILFVVGFAIATALFFKSWKSLKQTTATARVRIS